MAYFWVPGAGVPAVARIRQRTARRERPEPGLRSTSTAGTTRSRREGDTITLGKGGVDDAEDGEVIVHETGHSIHAAQVPGFGSTLESGSIGEAFGDYFSVTVGDWRRVGVPAKAPGCVADWDSIPTRRPCRTASAGWTGKDYAEDVAARSTRTVRSGRTHCSTSAPRSARRWPTGSSSTPSSASRRHQLRGGGPANGRDRSIDVRRVPGCCGTEGVRRPRHSLTRHTVGTPQTTLPNRLPTATVRQGRCVVRQRCS